MADTSQQSDADQLLKVRTVAEMFDVEPATVREWLKNGDLQGVKIGKGHYWRIPKSAAIELATKRYGSESQYE